MMRQLSKLLQKNKVLQPNLSPFLQKRSYFIKMNPTNLLTGSPGHITSMLNEDEVVHSKHPDPYRGFGGGGPRIPTSTPLAPYIDPETQRQIKPVLNTGRYDNSTNQGQYKESQHVVNLNKRGVQVLDDYHKKHQESEVSYFTTEHSSMIDKRRTTNCVGYHIGMLNALTGQGHEFHTNTKPQELFDFVGKNKASLIKSMIFKGTVDKSEGAHIPWVNTPAEELRSKQGKF